MLTVPAALLVSPLLGIYFTLRNVFHVARTRPPAALIALLNLPMDLLTNTLGFFGLGALYPVYRGRAEHPQVGLRAASLIFIGGPLGSAVSRMASGFTPTSTVFIARSAWSRLRPEERDCLINHELWHARRQFGRYSGWIFWPAYLVSNAVWGTHRSNPFESGPSGAYRNVDDRWDSGYRESADYLDCRDPFPCPRRTAR